MYVLCEAQPANVTEHQRVCNDRLGGYLAEITSYEEWDAIDWFLMGAMEKKVLRLDWDGAMREKNLIDTFDMIMVGITKEFPQSEMDGRLCVALITSFRENSSWIFLPSYCVMRDDSYFGFFLCEKN